MEECADSVMAFLTAQDADIICLQEFAMSDDTAVKSYLKSRFEGYDVEYYVYPTDKGCYGNATLSRFPLKGKGKLDFDSSSNLALYSDYDIFGTDLRVYNCHFQSYNVSIPHIVDSSYRQFHKEQGNDEKYGGKGQKVNCHSSASSRYGYG